MRGLLGGAAQRAPVGHRARRSTPQGYSPLVRMLTLAGILLLSTTGVTPVQAETTELGALINEAFQNNPELGVAEARASGRTFRVPQARSLPDPMVMFGYQNEGYDSITYGDMQGAQAMYSVSQMFPFPGKRGIRAEMAERDAESAAAMHQALRLNVAGRVAQLYYELFLAHKERDLVQEKSALYTRIEEAALSRYSAGMAPQQEVLMAQTEKYMLLERETMLVQQIGSVEAMLTGVLGRERQTPIPRPSEPEVSSPYPYEDIELIRMAVATSPEIYSLKKQREAAEAGVRMAEREYYPDVTLTASLFERSGEFKDMWALTAAFNIPVYYASRQRQALGEARARVIESERELEAAKLRLAAGIRDYLARVRASENLMTLYQEGLIPKTYQDFDLALSGYVTGKVEAITVVSRLKSLIDYETRYWGQVVAREKARAGIETITGRLLGKAALETP